MSKARRIHYELVCAIQNEFGKPSEDLRKKQALTTTEMMFGMYMAAVELEEGGVLKLDETQGRTAITEFVETHKALLLNGGEFMPKDAKGAHLQPARFVPYLKQAMEFFCDKWDAAAPAVRTNLIVTLLAHDTLTYPRLISYIGKWVPPDKSDLELTVIGWLYSDMNDAFTGAENSVNKRKTIAEQIKGQYAQKCKDKSSYSTFWFNLVRLVDKAFSLNFDKNRLQRKLKDSRVVLHAALHGHIAVEDIDEFIDKRFGEVYNRVILGDDDA